MGLDHLRFVASHHVVVGGPESESAICGEKHILNGTLNYFLKIFVFFRPKIICLALFLGKRGPPCENIDRDLHFAPVVGPFRPLQKILKNRDLEISKILSIGEVDRIYMASPRGLSEGKTEPPDYISMFFFS